jgi:broad specificity phosphatase PhoE
MGQLYLIRHGQASFGAEDYDNLSELGRKQAQQLGAYFKQKNLQFDAVITGTLRRHTQTWQGIAQGADFANTTARR